MSVDYLQEKIRKLKCPIILDLCMDAAGLPPHLLEEEESHCSAYKRFCAELMNELQEQIPAVRFSFGAFAAFGAEGIIALQALLQQAKDMGFYTLLDAPEVLSPCGAEITARTVFGSAQYPCDGTLINPYIGSDGIKPFLPYCKDRDKSMFVLIRSGNKSAWELQDLLTGSRHVYGAAAETINRMGEALISKCGYSRVCGVVGCTAPEALRLLRVKHNRTFFLVEGVDYSGGNAKNCSYAFDRFGHGAVVCAGQSVTAAWQSAESDGKDYLNQAVQATDRLKKNISRYVTIL